MIRLAAVTEVSKARRPRQRLDPGLRRRHAGPRWRTSRVVNMNDTELIERALNGEEHSVRHLIDNLAPVIQARVARTLLRRGGSNPDTIRAEVEDLTQEMFAVLFTEGGRVLRAWDPNKGMSLKNYVGLVAERRLVSLLRTDKRNPWRESPATTGTIDANLTPGEGAEREVLARQFLETVLDRLRLRLSERGLYMFRVLFVEDRSPDEVAATLGISRDAVHQWRSRCTKLLREIADQLLIESGIRPAKDPITALTASQA